MELEIICEIPNEGDSVRIVKQLASIEWLPTRGECFLQFFIDSAHSLSDAFHKPKTLCILRCAALVSQ